MFYLLFVKIISYIKKKNNNNYTFIVLINKLESDYKNTFSKNHYKIMMI